MISAVNLLRSLAFAILGAIVGYFVLSRITPLIGFSQGLGGIENVSILNAVLGFVIFGLTGLNLKKWIPILCGGLIGSFVSALISPILASLFTHGVWYSFFDNPTLSSKIFEPIYTLLWVIFVLVGIKLAIKINKKRLSAK